MRRKSDVDVLVDRRAAGRLGRAGPALPAAALPALSRGSGGRGVLLMYRRHGAVHAGGRRWPAVNAGNVYIFFSESDRPGGPWEQLSGVALMETLQAEIVENGDWRITNPEG